ncbi:MAG TPA: TonB-dependent receptor [Steroidobacteraceae bacterium]|nr:TonB-dependent receptor [Steroidobacteraceae bacterium]
MTQTGFNRDEALLGALAIAAMCGLLGVQGSANAEESDLEEILVTASRQETPALRTPFSIGKLDADMLALIGSTHHSESFNRLPATLIQRGSGQESLTAVRSPVFTGAGSCGEFLYLENGIPIRPVGFCNVNEMFEINTEQARAIEVLRGPGSALYGSNAVHGTINVLQPAPGQLPAFGIGLEAGPDDYYRLKGSGRLQDSARTAGWSAHYTHDGGWRDDSGFDEAKINAALAGTFGDTPGRMDLAATWLDQDTAGFILGKDAYQDDTLRRQNLNPEAYREAYAVRLTGLFEPDLLESARLEFRPYVRSSQMEFLQHFLLGKPLERNGQQSLGLMSTLRSETGSGWRVTTGLDLEYADTFLYQAQDATTTGGSEIANAIRPAGRHYDYDVRSSVAALYGQLERQLGERWSVAAGLRAEYVGYDYDNRMLAGNTDEDGVPCPYGGCLYSRPADREDSFFDVAPKLSVGLDLREGLFAYMTAVSGFRPPEATELYRLQRQQARANLDSEQIDSLELGLKGAWPRLDFALAAYTMRKKNVVLRESNGFYVGDGRTSHRGFEYQLGWQLLSSLEFRAAGSFARHRYEFSRAVEAGEQITKGNDIDTAPRQMHNFRLEWSPTAALRAEAEWQVLGEYWLDASNQHRYPGHELLNLRLGWQLPGGWMAFLRLMNALDREYADRADFAFGNYRYFPGRGRSLFAEIQWQSR